MVLITNKKKTNQYFKPYPLENVPLYGLSALHRVTGALSAENNPSVLWDLVHIPRGGVDVLSYK